MSEISPLVRLVDDDDAFRESQKLFLSMCPVFSNDLVVNLI